MELDYYYVTCSSVRKKVDYKGDKMIPKCNMQIDIGEYNNGMEMIVWIPILRIINLNFIAYEKLVYTRKCVQEAETAAPNSCVTDEAFNDNDNPNIQRMSCETCAEDGCNIQINNYFTTGIESSSSSFGLTSISESMILCLINIIVCSHRKIWKLMYKIKIYI